MNEANGSPISSAGEPRPHTTRASGGAGAHIVFGILAHNRPETLADQIANIRAMCPNADVRVFNGGADGEWCKALTVPVSPMSKPMRYDSLAFPHYAMCRDIAGSDFDCLVVLDSDMMIVKPGLEQQLGQLLQTFAYVGANLAACGGTGENEPLRSLLHRWTNFWSPVLGAATPYMVFNPGQVFRRDLVEAIAADASVQRILETIDSEPIQHPEEFLWPTYAVSRGFPTTSHPGSHGLEWRQFEPAELVLKWADPNVFLVHKVGMDLESPDRATIRRLAAEGANDEEVRLAVQDIAAQQVWFRPSKQRIKYSVKLLGRDVANVVRDRSRRSLHPSAK